MKGEAKLCRRTKGLIKGKEDSGVGSLVQEQCTLTPKRLCSTAVSKEQTQCKLKTKKGTSESMSWEELPPHKLPLQGRQLLPHILKEACAGASPQMGTRNNSTASPVPQAEVRIDGISH